MAVAPAAGALGGDQRRARAAEGVEDEPLALRAVENGVGDERDRLHGRVHGEVVVTRGAEGVDAGIGPDVRAVAAVLAELDVVDVRRVARLEDEDQLVLRAVERAHAAIGLRPDAEVLELGVGPACRGQDLALMAPVHADEVDRAVAA